MILDATRTLVLAHGPRAASVAAIAKASGAPAGTLYHRFGNRDGVLAAAWLRALDRFQALALAAGGASTLDAAVAMAMSALEFAKDTPDDARLLLTIRPDDLLDDHSDTTLSDAIAARNAPLSQRVREFAAELYGAADARSVDAVARAIVDLPYAVIRRHPDGLPAWLADDVATAVRALLTAQRG